MTAISYQLYSSRNFPPLADVIARLSSLGYKTVEGFGGLYPDMDAVRDLRALLDQHGMTMRSTHIGLDVVEGVPATAVAIAQTLGIKEAYVPFLQPDDRPPDAAGWQAFGARLVEAGKPLRDAGLTFGWHNHAFEYEALPTGEMPMDLILDGNDLAFEFDVAWGAVAGIDMLDVITKHGHRITAAHVKDRAPAGECADEDGWADVGHGVMDWPALIAALRAAGCANFVMEHDNPSDDQRFASRSIATVQTLLQG